VILTNVCCAESRSEAQERAVKYLGQKWQSIDNHYHFSDGHLSTVKGYESYGKMAKTYAKINDSAENKAKATEFYVSIQIVGTPDDCLQKIAELQRCTGMDHLVTEFSFGAMPHEEAEVNMRLFADRVMPVLQRDPAFAGTGALAPAAAIASVSRENVFAPA
jgi:alkanesulfonate monooxygenase SsuD/methylene tetrahydromethanopterin reductase-like flavin-dependent oxidoreductase (luciferase family)